VTGFLSVLPEAVNLSSVTELVISGDMAANNAAGAAALTGTVPMVPTSDDAAFSSALNAAGTAYLGAVAEHVGQRAAYAGAQGLSSIGYVVNELLGAVNLSSIV
jgi:energy-converting hydrogenase Eha subunit F